MFKEEWMATSIFPNVIKGKGLQFNGGRLKGRPTGMSV
jgi:hypothetical protein